MRIGVNALRLSGQRLGIGRYIEYLLKHWAPMLEDDERVVVYVREPIDRRGLELPDAFEFRVLPSRLDGVLWENLVLARRWRETDVLFCPSYTIPVTSPGRCVVATHSVNEAQPGTHPWTYQVTYRPRNQLCARRADAVIVPSERTKADVQRVYGVRPERISIVPEGVEDSFAPVDDEQALSDTRRRYFGEDRPYVLFVGKLSQRRNIPALIEAFANVKRREDIPHGLLLYGPNIHDLPLDRMAAELGIDGAVVQVNEKLAEHRDILPVYSAADLFVHPTSAEGFSLTIVEAMACGAPVITVGRGAVAEIVDGSARTVSEPSPEQLAAAMKDVIGDRRLHASIRAKALERSQHFRLSETARGSLEVLRQVASR